MTAAPAEPDPAPLATSLARALRHSGEPYATPVAVQRLARRLSRSVATVLHPGADPDEVDRVGRQVGGALVEARLTLGGALRAVLAALGESLPGHAVAGLQGGVAVGYADALKSVVLQQQESIHGAVLIAKEHAEAARRSSDARFRAIFAGAGMGIGVADIEGHVIDVNPALRRLLGFNLEEFRSRSLADFLHPQDAVRTWPQYRDLLVGRRDSFRTETWLQRRDGSSVWANLTVSLIRDDEGAPLYQVAMTEDVTVRHELEERLRHEATHDALTGLANRALFLDELQAAVADPADGECVGLCFLDLDGFKLVNDGLGHSVGDHVLTAVAERFAGPVRAAGGLLARLGGDEFVVLVSPSPGRERLVDLAGTLLASLDRPVDVPDGFPVQLSTSAGVVEQQARGAEPAELLRAADLTLHQAKRDGKGRVAVHDGGGEGRVTRYSLARGLAGALERAEFAVRYEPVVDLRRGGLHGVHARLQWHHPRFGPLDREVFVEVAEETGSVLGVGRWLLESACRDAVAQQPPWPGAALAGAGLLDVPVSAVQLRTPGFADQVAEVLEVTGLPPARLQLELPDAAAPDGAAPPQVLEALARSGVRLALRTSRAPGPAVAGLRTLPLHEVRLDTDLLLARDAVPGPVDVRILTALVELVHALGLGVVVDGVGTAEQDRWVRDSGCDGAHGPFYATALIA